MYIYFISNHILPDFEFSYHIKCLCVFLWRTSLGYRCEDYIELMYVCLFQQDSLQIEQLHRHELPRHEVSKVSKHSEHFWLCLFIVITLLILICFFFRSYARFVRQNKMWVSTFLYMNVYSCKHVSWCWPLIVFFRSSKIALIVVYVWGSTSAQNANSSTMM